jgi:hypothetical protein
LVSFYLTGTRLHLTGTRLLTSPLWSAFILPVPVCILPVPVLTGPLVSFYLSGTRLHPTVTRLHLSLLALALSGTLHQNVRQLPDDNGGERFYSEYLHEELLRMASSPKAGADDKDNDENDGSNDRCQCSKCAITTRCLFNMRLRKHFLSWFRQS